MKKTLITAIILILVLSMAACATGHNSGKAFLIFNNVDDFHTYVTTGSMKPEDYKDMEQIPYIQNHPDDTPRLIYNIDKESFIDVRDLIQNDEKLLENFKRVKVLNDTDRKSVV